MRGFFKVCMTDHFMPKGKSVTFLLALNWPTDWKLCRKINILVKACKNHMKMKVDYSHFERVTLFCNLLHGTFPHKIKACFTDGLLHYANSLEFYIKPPHFP